MQYSATRKNRSGSRVARVKTWNVWKIWKKNLNTFSIGGRQCERPSSYHVRPRAGAYQSAEDEEDHEESAESRLAVEVSVADGRHGDEREVDALPVRHRVTVAEVVEWVAGILYLIQSPGGIVVSSWFYNKLILQFQCDYAILSVY